MGNFLQVLPLELRRQIYRELLLAKEEIAAPGLDLRPKSPSKSVETHQLHPAILRVNKQTYSEASTILYEENKFYCNTTMYDDQLSMDSKLLLSDQYSMKLFDRVKHARLVFDPSLLGIELMLGNIVKCELQTLSLVFVFMSVDSEDYEELGIPEYDRYRGKAMATDMWFIDHTLSGIRGKPFKKYAAEAVRGVQKRLEVSV